MKKLTLAILFFIVLFFSMSPKVYAGSDSIDDQAGLFSQEEISQFEDLIAPIEAKSKARVFIVTTNQNNMSTERFADFFMLEKIGKNANGVTFLIDMDNRGFHISTSGNMIDYIDDKRLNKSLDDIEPIMESGNYFQAGTLFLENIKQDFESGVPGGHYRVDTETGKITRYKVLTGTEIMIAFALAVILSIVFLVINISKYRLKFGTYKYPFREKSSLDLKTKDDHLINSFITTRRIPKNNSNGGGGSGGSSTHSTGGGSFGGGGRSF